jgi:prolyl-tRNA editing enzyme YbaK/EbsC (Cys-tRNA(Pro) deacylase)
MPLRRADPNWVRDATGFAVGGVSPVGHAEPPVVLVDRDLAAFDRVWAAAGSPNHVFATTPDELLRISGGAWAVVREG